MKRIVILALSALLLIGALSACSASGYVGDPYYGDGYSNVSTTRDGTVNGTNPGYYDGYGYSYGYQGTYHGANGTTGTAAPNGTGRTTTGGTARGTTGSANTYTGTTSGTGMAGDR